MSDATQPARWYDGHSAKGRAVLLRVRRDEGVTLLESDGVTVLARFSLRDVHASSVVGATTRFLRLPDDTDVEVADGDALDRALAACGQARPLARRLEGRVRHVLGAALAIVVFAGLAYQYGIPWLAREVAAVLPEHTQSMLAGNALEQMDRVVFTPSTLTDAERDRLATLFGQLSALAATTPQPRLVLRGGGPLEANAFALPDGTVVVTDELVALAENDAQLAGVIAHEIGHVDHRHLLRAVLQNSAVALLSAVLLGDLDSLSALAGALPTLLARAAYSRDFEREADAYAHELLRRAGHPPQALAQMLERLAEDAGQYPGGDEGWGGYLQSHPPTSERMRALVGDDD